MREGKSYADDLKYPTQNIMTCVKEDFGVFIRGSKLVFVFSPSN